MASLGDLTAACIAGAFVPQEKQDTRLPCRRMENLREKAFEPGIACTYIAIVHIMTEVRRNPDKIGQPIGLQRTGKARERDDIGTTRWIVANIIKIDKRIMLLSIVAGIANKTGRGHFFHIGFPTFVNTI